MDDAVFLVVQSSLIGGTEAMTSPPDLPAQIEAVREPGWYWIRRVAGGPWRPHEWYCSRDGETFWAMSSYDDPVEIGPRIPDPVTLQQHERLEAALREPTEDLQDALSEAFDAAFLPAWREAIKKHGTHNVQPAWASWGRKYLTAIADALDAAAPETPETR